MQGLQWIRSLRWHHLALVVFALIVGVVHIHFIGWRGATTRAVFFLVALGIYVLARRRGGHNS